MYSWMAVAWFMYHVVNVHYVCMYVMSQFLSFKYVVFDKSNLCNDIYKIFALNIDNKVLIEKGSNHKEEGH